MNTVDGNVVILFHFDENGRVRAEQLENILKLVNISTVVGEDLCGQPISLAVRELIESAPIVVAVVTRHIQSGENEWHPSQWIIQEITWAVAHEVPVLLVVEQGVVFNGGLVGDIEPIPFKNGDFTSAAYRVAEQARAMMNSVIVPQEPPPKSLDDRVSMLIKEAREYGEQGRWREVKSLSEHVLKLDPNEWRARVNLALADVMLGLLPKGTKDLKRMRKDFAGNKEALPVIHHNLAWVEESRGLGRDMNSLRIQRKHYEKALSYDTLRPYTRASLILCLALMRERDAAVALLCESLAYGKVLCGEDVDFFDILRFEVNNRGRLGQEALAELPKWVYDVLFSTKYSNIGNNFSTRDLNARNDFPARDSNSYDESRAISNEDVNAKNRNKEIKMKTKITRKLTSAALTLLTIALMVVGASAASGQMG